MGSDGYVYGLNGDDNKYIIIPKLIQLYTLNMKRVLHVSQTSMKWNKIFKLRSTSYNPGAIVRLYYYYYLCALLPLILTTSYKIRAIISTNRETEAEIKY